MLLEFSGNGISYFPFPKCLQVRIALRFRDSGRKPPPAAGPRLPCQPVCGVWAVTLALLPTRCAALGTLLNLSESPSSHKLATILVSILEGFAW